MSVCESVGEERAAFFLHVEGPSSRATCSHSGRMFHCLHVCWPMHHVVSLSALCSKRDFESWLAWTVVWTMPALLQELVQQCSSLMSGTEEGERLVKVVHEALSILEDNGHVYGMKLKPSMVGVSPPNRDVSGLNPMDVH